MYTGLGLLLHIHPIISSFFFLSSFQTLKFFVTLFSGTVRPRRLQLCTHVDSGQLYHAYWNQAAAAYSSLYFSFFFLCNFQLGTHVDSGQMYIVYQNQAAAPYLSLYFFIFLFLQFSNMKNFRHTFRRNCETYKIETLSHVDTGHMYRVYRNQAAAAYSSLFFFIFLSNFQTLKFFVTLFSGTVMPRRLKLGTHVDSRQMYRVYRNQTAAAAYSSLYFSSFFFSPNLKH